MVTDRVRAGVRPGAELPVAHPHPRAGRSLRHAGQVIVWLLTGLAAAALYLLPYLLVHLVLAPAGARSGRSLMSLMLR